MGNTLTMHSIKPVATVLVQCDADPRSPTTAFRRTPLRAIRGTVPDLKDPRSPRCNRTPLRLAADLDPREPTAGIIRTPVPAVDSAVVDPREPTEGLVRTPVPERRSVRRRLQLGADADQDSVDVVAADDVDVAAAAAAFADGFVSISLEDSVDDDDLVDADYLLDGFDSAVEDDDVEVDSDTETEQQQQQQESSETDESAADSEVAHLLVYRSPMPKIRSVASARLPKQFASARNHDSLRKSMAMQMTSSPVRHGSPCAVRLVASCPSSPVAA